MTHGDYLTLLATADVVLDTTGYYGRANSTYNVNLGDEPRLSRCRAKCQRSRYTMAAYRQMALADCIATSPEDYVEKAVHWAPDAGYRDDVRRRIAAKLPCCSTMSQRWKRLRQHSRKC